EDIIKQTVEENGGKKSSETEEPQLPKKRQRTTNKEKKDAVDSKIQSQLNNTSIRKSKIKDNSKKTANKTTKKVLESKKEAKKSTSKTTEPSLSDDEPSDPIMVSTARGRWTTDDDKLLSNLVLAHLPEVRWSNIARENFPERNRSSLFNRWNVIKKRLWNGGFESKGEGKDD
ncbi:25727_t:CDS:2, partial [Gigaspora margarita]